MTLSGKVAIVTGGSRGIGAATARLLAKKGAQVVINYVNNSAAAEQQVAGIQAEGGAAIAVQADVTDEQQVKKLVDEAVAAYGKVDILVSNAAIGFPFKPFAQMLWDEFSPKLNNELKAAFNLTKAVVPYMSQQKYGRIIYVASGLSKNPSPGFIAHGTAKAGLASFAKYIAQEFGPAGITANVVSPGLVETDATADQPAETKRFMASITPLGRVAQPEDVAGAIAFFASDESRFMTGTYAPVNGGSAID